MLRFFRLSRQSQKSADASLRQVHNLLEERLVRAPESRVILGIGGPAGSGKTSLAHALARERTDTEVLSLDQFRLPRSQRPAHAPFGSHPDAHDQDALLQALNNFRSGKHLSKTASPRVLLAEGELAAYSILQSHLDALVLLQCSLASQLVNRILRDARANRMGLRKALRVFFRSNLREYPRFSSGASARAQLVLPRFSFTPP